MSATEWIMSVSGRALRDLAVQSGLECRATATSNSVSIAGPSGQNVSKPFARAHWPSVFCRSRAVMSFAIV